MWISNSGTDATPTARPRRRGWIVPALVAGTLVAGVVAATPALAGGNDNNGKDKQVFCNVEGNSGKWKAQIGGPSTEHEYPLIIDGDTVFVHDQTEVTADMDAACTNQYGQTDVTPAAPTFNEGSGTCVDGKAKYVNPTYTVPSTEDVEYVVNGTPKDADTYVADFGDTVKIVAKSTDEKVNLNEPTSWSHTFGAKPDVTCEQPTPGTVVAGTATCTTATFTVTGQPLGLTTDPADLEFQVSGEPPTTTFTLDVSKLNPGSTVTLTAYYDNGTDNPTPVSDSATLPASCGTTEPPVEEPPTTKPPATKPPTTVNNPPTTTTTTTTPIFLKTPLPQQGQPVPKK